MTAPSPDRCAGWRKIEGAEASVIWLAENDRPMLEGVVGHNETGQSHGCWK